MVSHPLLWLASLPAKFIDWSREAGVQRRRRISLPASREARLSRRLSDVEWAALSVPGASRYVETLRERNPNFPDAMLRLWVERDLPKPTLWDRCSSPVRPAPPRSPAPGQGLRPHVQ